MKLFNVKLHQVSAGVGPEAEALREPVNRSVLQSCCYMLAENIYISESNRAVMSQFVSER